MFNQPFNASIILEDGTTTYGYSVGCSGQKVSEFVFNTSITGYQEILTDPSYATQTVIFTYPHIGNTGINYEDSESYQIFLDGIIMREFFDFGSSYRMKKSLKHFLLENKTIAIANVDTRKLTRHIRNNGAMLGCISSNIISTAWGLAIIAHYKKQKIAILEKVSSKRIHNYKQTSTSPKTDQKNSTVVVLDSGVKKSILNNLCKRIAHLIVVPSSTPANKILALHPDGVVLPNGPGDPRDMCAVIEKIKKIIYKNIPILGICLGHQLIALCTGGKVIKMKFGHHGSNHPVYCVPEKKVAISSQNHNYCVSDVAESFEILSYSLFDGTIQGLQHKDFPIISFQGHPEGSPGPSDCDFYFDRFIDMIEKCKNNA